MSEHLERIERYLHHEMSPVERERFEQQLESDPHLRAQVDRMKVIDAAIEHSVEQDLRSQLAVLARQDTMNEESKIVDVNRDSSMLTPQARQPGTQRMFYRRLAAAAGILLLISAGIWYLQTSTSPSLNTFTAERYVGYDYHRLRSEESNIKQFPFDIAEGQDDQNEAIQWMETWLSTYADDIEARFILADLLKNANRVSEAKDQLAIIISQKSVLWSEKAEWNYVLLSIQNSGVNTAHDIYDNILNNPAHSYYYQAQELRKLIDK